jgi:hypothetical protein
LLKAGVIGEGPLRPSEDAVALRRQADKPLPALDDQDAEALFQLLDAGRKRRLRNITDRRRPGEVPFPRECRQILEVPNDHRFTMLPHAKTDAAGLSLSALPPRIERGAVSGQTAAARQE